MGKPGKGGGGGGAEGAGWRRAPPLSPHAAGGSNLPPPATTAPTQHPNSPSPLTSLWANSCSSVFAISRYGLKALRSSVRSRRKIRSPLYIGVSVSVMAHLLPTEPLCTYRFSLYPNVHPPSPAFFRRSSFGSSSHSVLTVQRCRRMASTIPGSQLNLPRSFSASKTCGSAWLRR